MENFIFCKVLNKRAVCSLQIRIRFLKKSRDWFDEIIYQLYLSKDSLNLSLSLRVQSEWGKRQTRNTPNTDTFHAAHMFQVLSRWVSRSEFQILIKKINDLTAQKKKFFIKEFFSKCDQIRRKLQIWSHVLKKSLMKNFFLQCFEDKNNMQTEISVSVSNLFHTNAFW